MDISLFEVVGPIMMGPSSSATAGMARIGATANRFLTEPVRSIDLKFTPRYIDKYVGNRSHLALLGGVLGISENDSLIKQSLEMAHAKGIKVTSSVFPEPAPLHALTVKVTMELESGRKTSITAVSVGGGSIAVIGVEEFDVDLAGTEAYVFAWSEDRDMENLIQKTFPDKIINKREKDGKFLFYISVPPEEAPQAQKAIAEIPGVTRTHYIAPIIPLGFVSHKPLFTTYEALLEMSKKSGKSIAELAIEYEKNRSGRSEEVIWRQMADQLEVMKEAKEKALSSEIVPLYGFESGNEAKKLMKAYVEGETLGGSVLPKAVAIAIGTMEYSTSMTGCIVAAPTGGSSGILPGAILTISEERGVSDEDLIKSMFVAAALGAVMYYHRSTFSGSAGGCQAEVGISSAITAGALVFLGGGSSRKIIQAVTLGIKNIMGLICDPIGCSEVPCIKRNGIGVANAFTSADMALAGIESFIPADEVIKAFVDVQRILPVEMRGGGGGVAGTETAKAARETIKKKDAKLTLPRLDVE